MRSTLKVGDYIQTPSSGAAYRAKEYNCKLWNDPKDRNYDGWSIVDVVPRPVPIKKKGWIVMFKGTDGRIHIPTSHPQETEEKAFGEWSPTAWPNCWSVEIEWEEMP